MSRWFVTPDLHGSVELAEGLLRAADVPLAPEARKGAGVVSVQLGDLANCVARSGRADAELLDRALSWYDVVLVGNHEHPHFGGSAFKGFFPIPEVKDGLRRLERARILRPCLLAGDVLLTHAGLVPNFGYRSAAEAAREIALAWRLAPQALLFSACGQRRGGSHPFGGILWSHFTEPRAPFRQVHGHTPMLGGPYGKAPDGEPLQIGVRSLPGQGTAGSLNLDVGGGKQGARLVGAWLDEDGAVELVEYRRPD